jgi:PAS domain S-box-containing protein
MTSHDENHSSLADEYSALKSILEGTVLYTGDQFFRALVKTLAQTLNTKGAWITEFDPDLNKLKAISFWMDDHYVDEYEYNIAGTPCEQVLERRGLFHVPDNVIGLFPDDPDLKPFEAMSYLGAPILAPDGVLLGHLAVQDTRPMPEQAKNMALFRIFADRASSEMRRIKTEYQLRERENQLSRLVDSVMDAIIEIDSDLTIIQANKAAVKLFEDGNSDKIYSQSFERFLVPNSAVKLKNLLSGLQNREKGSRFLWVPGGFKAVTSKGKEFQSEATLSCYEHNRKSYFNLVLRNVSDRLEAEKRIDMLQAEKEILKQEIREIQQFDEILGNSSAIKRVMDDVQRVAETDATVLITGETGTGKELFARVIHSHSHRSAVPMVKVNCAAIPDSLIESEFFGHEKGAFTGATEKRKGRFELADGGTIFLDEIGEMPSELQPKLLRVLQEGEFEPVGSSISVQVDVRVVAATNRDLAKMVKEGTFREDLFYRLHVFPITVPPLRERNDDIILLAEFFINKYSLQTGKKVHPLSPADIQCLRNYPWPGNIRELQNVIERALITSVDGELKLVHILRGPLHAVNQESDTGRDSGEHDRIYTAYEIKEMERRNLTNALAKTGGKISGKNGAASLIGIPPTTFTSRMKALDIQVHK